MTLVEELFAADLVDHTAPPGQAAGIAGLKQNLAIFRSAFPDTQITVEDLFAEGDRVAVMRTARATQTGSFFGIPPTGRQVTVPGMAIFASPMGRSPSTGAIRVIWA